MVGLRSLMNPGSWWLSCARLAQASLLRYLPTLPEVGTRKSPRTPRWGMVDIREYSRIAFPVTSL